MKFTAIRICQVAAVLLAGLRGQTPSQASPATSSMTGRGTPVLVELFTSEGCSSCPPADALLAKLEKTQPVPGAAIIVLSEHVDYWNHDGWTDPFSSPEFTTRQQAYCLRLGEPEPYTPQMVVDGAVSFVGSNASKAQAAIATAAREPKLAVTLGPGKTDGTVAINIAAASGASADVLAAFVDESADSDVRRGENQGRRLHHVSVVRSLREIGHLDKNSSFHKEIAVGHNAGRRLVVFVQASGSHHVLGAAVYRPESRT